MTFYESEKTKIQTFLLNNRKYVNEMRNIAKRLVTYINIQLGDVEIEDVDLATNIRKNTRRYQKLFFDVIDEFLPTFNECTPIVDNLDVFIKHHLALLEETGEDTKKLPRELLRRYQVCFLLPPNQKPIAIRQLRASQHLGKMVKISGVVTRVSEARPKLTVATYTCDTCRTEAFQEIVSKIFTPVVACRSEICTTNKLFGRLSLQTRGSKFVSLQEIKIQENCNQVGEGNLPQSLTVYAVNHNTNIATPGDHVNVDGVFLPLKKNNFNEWNDLLVCESFLEAQKITLQEEDGDVEEKEISDDQIRKMTGNENFYEKLSSSIAPEIFGHADIKKV